MEYVADLLREKNIYFTSSGRDYLIKCLNPDHEDSNPSMRVDKTTGVFHCFACGHKGDLFKYYGILSNLTFIKVAKLKEKIANLKIDREGLSIPPVAIPYLRSFRGVSAKTLQHFEAFYLPGESKELKGFEDRIIFPLKDITGKIRLFQGRHTLSNVQPKYLFYPRNTEVFPYPPSIEKGNTSLVLVEGIFDMLNCFDKGLTNVVSVFGTNSLQKDTKLKLLPYKMQGVSKIYLMFDGDEAGREAAKKLKPIIEACEFEVEIIPLEDDTDPGSLSPEYITSIKEYIDGRFSNSD